VATRGNRLTWRQVRSRRLHRSLLARRAPNEALVDAVRDVGGIQAQVAAAAEIAIAARVSRVTRAQVRDALWQRRTLVKTWTLRGTLHLHPADEIGLWLAARRATRSWMAAAWMADEGLSRREGERVLAAIAAVLDGRCLTRAQLAAEIGKAMGGRIGERLASGWAHLLGPAAVAGILCHGPPHQGSATFVRLDQWLGASPAVPDDPLAEAAQRFLAAYGPATPRSFREWFRAERDETEAAFRRLRLDPVEVEGRQAFVLAGDDGGSEPVRSVRLLPEYDAYVMGFRERGRLLPEGARDLVREHPRGRLEGPAPVPWLLVDGLVAGSWARRRERGKVTVDVRKLQPLGRTAGDALERERARLVRFLVDG
jgi:Winged helix DNA-binding domain